MKMSKFEVKKKNTKNELINFGKQKLSEYRH